MVRYRLEIKKSAAKEIERLPSRDITAVLRDIKALSENPRPHRCTKLSGEEKHRIRCGDYCIIYSIEDNVLIVCVVKVRHRKDAYRH